MRAQVTRANQDRGKREETPQYRKAILRTSNGDEGREWQGKEDVLR